MEKTISRRNYMLNYIWNNEEVLDEYELPEITNEEIEKVEKLLGVKLPASYVNLMREKNGGTLSYNIFPSKKVEDDFLMLDYLLGIGMEDGIGETPYMIEEWELPSDIILLSGDGHSWVVLDYRNYSGDNPPISFIDVEVNKDIKIANSFEEFISKLEKHEDDFELDDENKAIWDELLNFSCTEEELEKYIKEGRRGRIIDGFDYFATENCDINWFFEQVNKAIQNDDYTIVEDIEKSIIKKMYFVDKQEWPLEKMNEIVEQLMLYPNHTVNRFSMKIKRKMNS